MSCEPDVRHLLSVTDTIEVSPDEGIHFLTKAEDVATMHQMVQPGSGEGGRQNGQSERYGRTLSQASVIECKECEGSFFE